MRVDRTYLGNESDRVECSSVQDAIELFRAQLSQIDLDGKTSGPSIVIKSEMAALAKRTGWEKKFLFSREAHSALPNANYTVNFLFVEAKCECGSRHKVFFHLCFDNRQAIGTHLLRFKTALVVNAKQDIDRPVGVVVVADSSAKAKFGWDNSAGTYEEFAQAIELEYAEILELSLHFLIVRS